MENNYDNASEENFLPGIGKENSFALPEGYFDSFPARMMNRLEFEQELEEYKMLSAIDRQLKFSVPQNYFDTLDNILEYKYECSLYPQLGGIAKSALNEPPSGYFESLDKKIANRIEASEELEEFKLLGSLEKKNTFTVAPEYFESSIESAKEIHKKTDRPAVSIFKQVQTVVLHPRMAYAASLVLVIGLAAFWYFNRGESPLQTGDCKTLACLQKNELLNEKNINDFDDDNLYDMVDVEQLDKNMSEKDTSNDSLKKEIKE
jgi:hypothetical protein